MTNAEASAAFQTIARILTLLEENPFKIRAYERVAASLESAEDIGAIHARDGAEGFRAIPGVGQDLAAKLEEIVTTGKLAYLDEMKKKVPAGLFDVMEIPGMGPKKTAFLWKEFGVKDVAGVEKVVADGKLDGLKGWGDKSIENLKRGIEVKKQHSGRFRRDIALAEAERILAVLRKTKGCGRAEYAGSLRRGRETVGDIDVLACGKDPEALIDAFLSVEGIADQLARGDTRAAIRLSSGLQCDLRVVPSESFGAAWHYFTGSKEHNVRLRQMGIDRGLTINEYGVHEGSAEKKGKLMASETEEDIYGAVGLPWIPPQLRENRGEFDAAEAKALPALVEEKDLKGDLHMHSTWSDGAATMADMAKAAKAAGLAYVAITDHASSMGMVKGTKDANVDEYVAAVRAVADAVPDIEVLAGAEVDIEKDGSLYLADETLEKLDWVTVSIHGHFGLGREEQTARLVKAVSHPLVHCLSHPTARELLRRDPVDADWDAVFAAAAEHGTAVEINASPHRLDLNDVLARKAKEKGVMVTIGSDAHGVAGLSKSHGVVTAQRAWLTKGDVLTCKPWKEFQKWLKRGS